MRRFARLLALLFAAAALVAFAAALAQRHGDARGRDARTPRTAHPGAPAPAAGTAARADSLAASIVVSHAWLAERVGAGARRARAIDARPRADFERAHIPGAISLPAEDAGARDALVALLVRHGVAPDETLVCYTGAAPIEPAARLAWLLECAGARAVLFLDGGIDAWRDAGRAVASGSSADTVAGTAPGRPAAAWPAAGDSSRIATHAFVLERFGEKGIEIIDARGPEAWGADSAGLVASQWNVAGHIPHSLPFAFASVVRADGTLAPAAEIQTALRRAGPRPATPIDLASEFIVYDDGGGGDAALGYLVLRAARIERVRCYPEGWAAWSSDPANPRVRLVGAAEVAARAAARADTPLLLFDMRTSNDYKAGHIPGATLLAAHQFEDSLDTIVEQLWPGLDRARTPLTTYCYGADCIRSRNGCTWAARRGFLLLEWFRGGIAEWERAKLPTERAGAADSARDEGP